MLQNDIIRGYHKMVVRPHRVVAQQIIVPGSIKSGSSKSKNWWLTGIFIAISFFFGMVGVAMEPDQEKLAECDELYGGGEYSLECQELQAEMETSDLIAGCGGGFCCLGLIMMVVALSTGNAANKTIIVQQGYVPQTTMVQPQQQVIRTGAVVNPRMTGRMPLETNRPKPVNQQPTVQSSRTNQTKPNNQTSAPSMDEIDKLAKEAKNLELARDFTKAAEMYQKAGLFAEAGRIRQTYLENDKPIVQIGQIGDSVVKDSVIMGEQKSNLCPGCGVVIQPEWNFCPSCNSPL